MLRTLTSYRKWVSTLMFTILALLQLNAIVFRHAHRLKDGRIIVHSHPFNPVGKSPIQPNNHNEKELITLDALSNGVYEQSISFDFSCSVESYIQLTTSVFTYTVPAFSQPFVCYSHRGPPVFCL